MMKSKSLLHISTLALKATLVFSVVFAPLSYAQSENLRLRRFQSKLHRAYLGSPQLKRAAESGAIRPFSAGSTFTKVAGHYGQTVFLIWIIAGVEAYRQHVKLNPVSDDKFDVKLLGMIFDKLINDMELVSGMAGASATTLGLSKPLAEMQAIIQSQVSKEFFRQLLVSGAMSFVTFVGWEAGSQLWKEAVNQVSDSEYSRAEKLRFFDVLGALIPEKSIEVKGSSFRELENSSMARYDQVRKQQDLKLFFKVLWKGFEILSFQKPDLTGEWIYNTWRNRIATGEFLTLVTGMVTGGTVAGSLVPGAGNVAGFFLGLAGGVAGGILTIAIPESWKHPITKSIRNQRLSYNKRALKYYGLMIENIGKNFKYEQNVNEPLTNVEQKSQDIAYILGARYESRNAAFNPIFEEIYYWKLKVQEATALNELVNDRYVELRIKAMDQEVLTTTNNQRRIFLTAQKKGYLQRIEALRNEAQSILNQGPIEILEAYNKAFEMLDQELASMEALKTNPNVFYPTEQMQLFSIEIQKLQQVRESLELIAMGTLTEFQSSFELTQDERFENESDASKVLNAAQARGFDEAWFY